MRLHEFLNLVEDKNKLLDFLINKKVIHGQIEYPRCKASVNLNRISMLFTCYVLYVMNNADIKNDIKCSVILNFVLIGSRIIMIGGEGVAVEIDEAKIDKRKFNKGRLIIGQWIFGGFERETGRLFVECVTDRSAKTLLRMIKKWIKPGTTMISDWWKAYNCLEIEGYKHLSVNHSYNFVDPDTKAHTQNIERAWRDIRANIPRFGTRQYYAGYIAEFLFKRKFQFTERIQAFFNIMAKHYPLSL